jgi:hypothetical protein
MIMASVSSFPVKSVLIMSCENHRKGGRALASPGRNLMVRDHLYIDGLGQDAKLVFTSPDGQPLRHSNFYRRAWAPALIATGLTGTDLHTCGTPATSSSPTCAAP